MGRRLMVAGLALAALVLLELGLCFVGQVEGEVQQIAWAAEEDRPRPVVGQVVETGTDRLVVQTRDGQVEVAVTDETEFRVPGVEGATFGDVGKGAWVMIRASLDESGGMRADVVLVRPAHRLQQHLVRGTVTEVREDQILVDTGADEAVPVLLTNTTHMWVPREPPTKTVDLAIGDPLLVLGKPVQGDAGRGALAAWLLVLATDDDLPRLVIQGQVVAVTQQTLIVKTGRGERAITVLPRTRLQSVRGRLDSLRDVSRGDRILALGRPTEWGQWIAGLVYSWEPRARQGP
jgi:RNase P/RNase MRP subunit p29